MKLKVWDFVLGYSKLPKAPGGGERGYSTNVYTARLRPEVQSLTRLCTIFYEKVTPFVCHPFNCFKCTVWLLALSIK